MAQTIEPKSDQLNAEDLLTGPRTVTITGVSRGSSEQPVDIHVAEFDRPFRPCKTVRRILVAAWGVNAATYVGRRMTIYRDPAVKFGGMDVGGIRVSHLSHIDKRITIALTATRGKRAPYVVEPLATPARQPEPAEASEPGITNPQMKKLHVLLPQKGYSERDAALAYLSDVVGRDLTSSKELTKAEAMRAIDDLESMELPAPQEPPLDGELWPDTAPPGGQ